jgi:hypothetical protein
MATTSWSAYVSLHPNPDSSVSQNDYVKMTAGPAYRKMVHDAGGKDSDEWKLLSKDLIKRFEAVRGVQSKKISTDTRNQAGLMTTIAHRWEKDLDHAKSCGVHVAVIMVASDDGAAKANKFLVNSDFMKGHITQRLGTEKVFLPQIHQQLSISENKAKDTAQPLGRDYLRSRCTVRLKEMGRDVGMHIGDRFPWKRFFGSMLLSSDIQLVNWPDYLSFVSFTEASSKQIPTTDWQHLHDACFTEGEG